ncbi:MAG TPA: hypothetical protein VF981_13220 [Gemmatimonadaceae bacterium]
MLQQLASSMNPPPEPDLFWSLVVGAVGLGLIGRVLWQNRRDRRSSKPDDAR